MHFVKMEGCGNDYIYIDGAKEKLGNPSWIARKISDRHFGVGADGMIVIYPSIRADFRMEMYNADGSKGAMCGNGIRCVGEYVYEYKKTSKKELCIETDSGIKKLYLDQEDGKITNVKVCMGIPKIVKREHLVSIHGKRTPVTIVSMGNPHAVLFVPSDAGNWKEWDMSIAERISVHSDFREGINVELVQVFSEYGMKVRVWERGTGETLSCGTGACAAVAAALTVGKTSDHVKVEMPGGVLSISGETESGNMYLEGKSSIICEGEYYI